MPSARRIRLLGAALLAGIVLLLLWSSHHPEPPLQAAGRAPAPAGKNSGGGGGAKAEGDEAAAAREMADRLKEAEKKAKDLANSKAPLKPDSPAAVVGVGSSADGQNEEGGEEAGGDVESKEEHVAEQELRAILKKAPVIIFSKTYCPFSKKAKAILLDGYAVDPPPHVVELDVHPQGAELQALLGEKTGRSTVPNVMVNGVSIGGGDDVAELHDAGELALRVETLGEARGVEVKPKGDGVKGGEADEKGI